ncbi:imm11 family protein [Bacteroides caecimuris]|uniref:imm11 family protein n=1 Tax=Bacteroides caecimuris TaxID=1796613 RepID=UPI000F4A223F|nr:DUF1629 domain-containing protein [Bacteroides caecimuris]ROT16554.1 hypothetical protein EEL51_13650 [Muribaculaceae bacterium Isolate-110 (HZI)]
MYYVWCITNKYPNSYWLKYDWKNNPDYLMFLGNTAISIPIEDRIIFELNDKVSLNSFLRYDYIMSDAVPLISKKLASIIRDNNIDGLQLIEADVYYKGSIIGEYYIPVFLNVVDCIDENKSIFNKEIGDYTLVSFKPNSLSDKMIVKAKGLELWWPIVQEEFVKICRKNKIKGIDFHKEPYINTLYTT